MMHKTKNQFCAHCGSMLNKAAVTDEKEDRPPEPGDVTVCQVCGERAQFNAELKLVPLTEEEFNKLTVEQQKALVMESVELRKRFEDCHGDYKVESLKFLMNALEATSVNIEEGIRMFANPMLSKAVCMQLAVLAFVCRENGKPEDEVVAKRAAELVAALHIRMKHALTDTDQTFTTAE